MGSCPAQEARLPLALPAQDDKELRACHSVNENRARGNSGALEGKVTLRVYVTFIAQNRESLLRHETCNVGTAICFVRLGYVVRTCGGKLSTHNPLSSRKPWTHMIG